MNEVIKAIKERRSIRKFKSDMPSKEDIAQIVECGLYAPSGRNSQETIILAITNKEMRDRLMRANCRIGGWEEGFDPFYGAPVILVVLTDKRYSFSRYDGGIVMQNLMLSAHSLGLGSIWIHRAREEFEMDEFKAILKDLGVEGDYEGVGHCAIGYTDGETPKAAPRKDNRVFWIE